MKRGAGSIRKSKRRAILAAASELLNRPSPAPTLAEIARAAGVTRQTIYNRFGGLGGLVDEVLAERRDCPACPASSDAAPRFVLETYAARLCAWFSEAYARSALLEQQGRQAGLGALQALASLDRAAESLARFLAEESARGRLDVRHAPAAAELFLSMVAGRLALSRAELTAHGAPEDEARACVRLFLRAHAPRLAIAPVPHPGRAGRPPYAIPQERAS